MERATTEDRTRRRPTPAWVPVVLVAVVYAVLSAFANGSAWAHGVAHTLQTSGGNDVGEEVWFLAETPWILLHGHNPFANDWLNTPVGVDLMDNTTMPVLGLLFAPVTLLLGPVATFNVVLDVSIWASAMSFFLMARRFVRWWPAAFVGGLLYGFSPYTAAVGNGHLFLLFQAAPPLIILFLDRFLRSDTASPWWAGFWVGACYVVQFYVSTEAFACLLVMTLWAVVLALAYVLWRRPAVDWARLARLGACAVAVVVIFTGYAAWTAVDGPEHVNGPVQSLERDRRPVHRPGGAGGADAQPALHPRPHRAGQHLGGGARPAMASRLGLSDRERHLRRHPPPGRAGGGGGRAAPAATRPVQRGHGRRARS